VAAVVKDLAERIARVRGIEAAELLWELRHQLSLMSVDEIMDAIDAITNARALRALISAGPRGRAYEYAWVKLRELEARERGE